MLTRVLESEVMDAPAAALEYDAMDHSQVNRQFVDDLLRLGDLGDEVLDLGTGTALIPIELCRRTTGVQVTAVDLAPSMLDLAAGNIDAEGLRDRIRVDRVDAKALSYEDGRFACVVSNSLVHHIAEPRSVLAEAVRVVSADGRVFFRDLLRPDSEEQLAHLVATYAGEANEHQRRMFSDSLRAALTLDEIRALVAEFGAELSRSSPLCPVEQTSDRHWTWNVVRRI